MAIRCGHAVRLRRAPEPSHPSPGPLLLEASWLSATSNARPAAARSAAACHSDISSRKLRGFPDLVCKLRSSTRIECDDRVNVSRVEKAVDDWINQTAQTVEVNVLEVPKLGNALAGRPKWVAGRPHRETRSGAW